MSKTSAILKYRTYIPYDWIAIPFCDLSFTGVESDKMQKKWDQIKMERYEKFIPEVEEIDKEIEKVKTELSSTWSTICKPWYRPWYNKKEKKQLKKIDLLNYRLNCLKEKKEETEDKLFFTAEECKCKAEFLLKENDFYISQTSSSGKECITYTDIWIKEK
jgi:hypothetical protein